jgi:hypothetical protein
VQCKPFVVFAEEGAGQLAVSTATDAAGNTATATVVVNIDFTAPVLTVEPIVSAARTPTVASAFLTLKGTVVETVSGLRSLTCNGNPATVTGTSYTCSVTLQAGINRVEIAAVDRADSRAAQFVNVTLDVTPPSLSIPAPGAGSEVIETDLFQLVGYTDDESGIASVTVNGQAAAFDQGKFVHQLQLREGDNAVTIVTTDKVGNARTRTVTLRRVTRVSIKLTSPADLSTVNSATVTVIGRVSPSSASVVVNDVVATVSNGTFTAHGVPLAQGRTVITAIVTGPTGVVSVANLNIYRDSIPPRVTIYSPVERAVVRQSPITVTGMVDDIVVGTINGEQLTVTVNGVPASVRNRAFLATNVPLTPGSNTLTVVATDEGGNSTTVTRAVTYDTSAATKLTIVSGNAQQAAIGTTLPAPLVVRLTGPTGAPVANAEVTFSIVQNNGTVSDGATSDRVVTVLTDAAGEARASWTLGERAGAGNNRVSAGAQGAGSVEFHATARTGAPANVVVDTGSSQFGLVRERVQRPMIAVVVDSGSNRLADVPVTFTVTRGGGDIDGKRSVTVLTDSDGRAWVSPALGPERGNDNNVIEASVDGVAAKAVFVASGRIGGDPSQTRISGVVLDNMNLPIAGVTLRVDETTLSARTNAQGQFVIPNARSDT